MISAIVAMNPDGLIGDQNKIPWHLPADLKYFKKITLGHHILMGRKCFDSIGKSLPGRKNIVVTKNPTFIVTDCIITNSIEEGILIAQQNKEEEMFILGGGEIYRQSMHLVNKLYLTMVQFNGSGDVFFPQIDYDEWSLISDEKHTSDDKNNYDYSFLIYKRK
ncbi:MAG: dihydrofolate reductase [Saprospiraceae bacterium]|nr:dihydrofolate reductase [Candidatus Vicinibacter affinis]MBK7693351.1 dihydrofolate reductase [Candidatus Vicinibacter affinis]MBK7798168.1 dihydrofolate reductase [Candidatus Vicinibacter affinis]MBK8403106.1 dihydrofolate reductase [Candidatus Vicinibacter affinis]MBK8642576.1 dihydrofolate reductase [Candidatus Vicinibacter affinis]